VIATAAAACNNGGMTSTAAWKRSRLRRGVCVVPTLLTHFVQAGAGLSWTRTAVAFVVGLVTAVEWS